MPIKLVVWKGAEGRWAETAARSQHPVFLMNGTQVKEHRFAFSAADFFFTFFHVGWYTAVVLSQPSAHHVTSCLMWCSFCVFRCISELFTGVAYLQRLSGNSANLSLFALMLIHRNSKNLCKLPCQRLPVDESKVFWSYVCFINSITTMFY